MEYSALLTDHEVERVDDTSKEILDDVGILVRNNHARDIYAEHDCKVDSQTGIVKIPRCVVEEYQKAFVPTFSFLAPDPEFDRTIPDDSPVIVTASSAPNIVDPDTGEARRATSTDIANIAFLINRLPGYDVFSISTLAEDAPKGQFSISRFYPAFKNCKKPIRGNTPNMEELHRVLEMGEIIAGGKEAYRERPLITHHCCPMISPLTMDIDSTEQLIYLVEQGLPVYGTIVPDAGLTAPMSLTGTLALANAEFLALSTLMQMIRPGTPLIYAVLSTVADLRTATFAPGAIETGMLMMAHRQMAGFYGVPSGGYVGLTNAHANDAQSGYETGMSTTAALLAGTDMFNMGGLLSSLMAFDFAKATIDNEIGLMLKRIKRGMEFSEEDLSLDLIKDVGHGGNFIYQTHTLNHMKTTAFLPIVATHEMRGAWESNGRAGANVRAMKEVRKILSIDTPSILSEEVDMRIRERFPGMVTGEVLFENSNVHYENAKDRLGGF